MKLSREELIRTIEAKKVIAIVRGVFDEDALELAKALYKGGVRLMELTFDQKDEAKAKRTAESIRLLVSELDEMCFGAGTVLTVDQVEMARDAGASFIVSPDMNESVIRRTVLSGLVSIPGALTPTEIASAYRYGADFVKVFPADLVGPSYFKAVHAPLSHVRLLAVGGVNTSSIGDYLRAGACGAGVAGCLFNQKLIAEKDWDAITENTKALTKLLDEVSAS